MEQERKFIYTLILSICILISALLLGRMAFYQEVPVHTPHTAVRTEEDAPAQSSLTLADRELTTLFTRQLPEDWPLTDFTMSIEPEGCIRFSGQIQRDALDLLDGLPVGIRMMLPSSCTIEAAVSVGCDQETHALSVEPVSCSIGGMQVPANLLQPLTQALADSLTSGLHDQGVVPQSIYTEQGQLHVALA